MLQLQDNVVSSIYLSKQFYGDVAVNSLEFSRDGSTLCCASDDESIRIYNMELGTYVDSLAAIHASSSQLAENQ
jgi:WD40 repeat protein